MRAELLGALALALPLPIGAAWAQDPPPAPAGQDPRGERGESAWGLASPHAWKVKPHLRARLRDAARSGERVPVYFVLRDRLGAHTWLTRVRGLDPAGRRALVVRELREHAARSQARLLAQLRSEECAGRCTAIRSSWLANVVRVCAPVDVIERALPLADVWEVWEDRARPLWQVEDAAPPRAPAGLSAPTPPSPSTIAVSAVSAVPPVPLVPGDGPLAVGADRVWALGFTGQGIVVMNADSGINVQHQALRNQLWTNPGEIPNNRIDDDRNGFVDDVHGWEFGFNTGNIDDNGGHGTQTAGVLVGDGSCQGTVYGIAPGGEVMTGKLLDEASQWAAVQYAILMGAQVQTSSHSYKNDYDPPPNYMVHRDVAEASLAAGLVRTNSTSNNGGLCSNSISPAVNRPFNVSVPGNMPPPYLDPAQSLVGRLGGVIGVGAFDVRSRQLASFSPCGPSAWDWDDLLLSVPNYNPFRWDPQDNDYPWHGGAVLGLLKPDVLAPAGTMAPASPGATCNALPFGGTSNATPIVAGCLMLWLSANPSLTPEDLAMILHQTSDDYGMVRGKESTYGAGRVDAFAGVLRALAVHRVAGESAWKVVHRGGTPLTLEIDGSPNRPALIAVGLERRAVSFGWFGSGIGSQVLAVTAGTTGATGSALRCDVNVAKVAAPISVFTQAFVDDTGGPTGRVLSSNVVEIQVVP